MNLLAIETSSPVLSVAIKKNGGKVRHATVKGYMKHAENLLPVIDRLLKKERLKIHDIDAFLIGRGPGSFTGLRIGFATLKGLIATRPKPCYGAFSLDMIAGAIPTLQRPGPRTGSLQGIRNLHVLLDAKRGKLYTRSYRYHQKTWKPSGPVAVHALQEVIRGMKDQTLIAGDGILTDKEHVLIKSGKARALPEKLWHPKASTLVEWFEGKNPMLKPLIKMKELLPVYFRSSEAEERHREKKLKHKAS